jgi:alpha-N-arabinofuranosidase
VVTRDPATGSIAAFSVNRSTTDPIQLDIDLSPLPPVRVVEHLLLDGGHSTPTGVDRDRIGPQAAPWEGDEGRVSVLLPPIGWSMLRLGP